jgi:hypothetical protein
VKVVKIVSVDGRCSCGFELLLVKLDGRKVLTYHLMIGGNSVSGM